jgi:predicted DNA-binding transcriptional regulator AlpA
MPEPNLKPTNAIQPSKPQATISVALAIFNDLPDCGFVRLPVVAALFGVGPATIWRWVKSGRICAPRKIGPNTAAWTAGELRRSMRAVAAEKAMTSHSHPGNTAPGLVAPICDGRPTVMPAVPLGFAEDRGKDFPATPQVEQAFRAIEGKDTALEHLARLQAEAALRGIKVRRREDPGAGEGFFVNRRGFSKELPDLEALARFLAAQGVRA